MRHIERESGHGAEHRDAVLRTVLFAFVSVAAWWCCSNIASADGTPPATPPASPPTPADAPAIPGSAPPSQTTASEPQAATAVPDAVPIATAESTGPAPPT